MWSEFAHCSCELRGVHVNYLVEVDAHALELELGGAVVTVGEMYVSTSPALVVRSMPSV